MSEQTPVRRRVSGGTRLFAFYTLLVNLQLAVVLGGFQRTSFHADDTHVVRTFINDCFGSINWMITMLTLGSVGVAAIALTFRWARGAAAGTSRDPVIQLRNLFRRHVRFAAVVPWLPLLWKLQDIDYLVRHASDPIPWAMPGAIGGSLALLVTGTVTALAARFALRSLDRVQDRETEALTAVHRDETTFQAVAVTARTQGAVFGMTALTLAMIYGIAQSGPFWMRDFAGGLPLVGYALASAGFAYWFRKASTIAVGRDGILIRGTSKERFYSYQDFDEVRLAGMHIDFHRAAKRVLRLQLHGTDDARADALAERIRGALAASTQARTAGAHLLARSAVGGSLGRAAHGATDYRQPAISREQLWELVEGEATDQQARVAAAEALAGSSTGDERARLRIAATHVADPKIRIALEDLADEDGSSETPLARSSTPERGAPLRSLRVKG